MDAVIFDMDGLLIDSEPLWKEAEKQVFSSLGVNVTDELSAHTASMTTTEVTQFWHNHSPWSEKELHQVENEVINRVETLICQRGDAMEGVAEILAYFADKKLRIGLATNSPARLIPVVLKKLGISDYFHAVSSSEHEIQGKPHPAVYLSTAKKLRVEPTRCIAFEDSVSGIIAATKANIKTVAVPPTVAYRQQNEEISHLKLRRLSDFTDFHFEKLTNYL